MLLDVALWRFWVDLLERRERRMKLFVFAWDVD